MSRCRDHELIGKPLPCGCPPGCCPCKAKAAAAKKRIKAFFETDEGRAFAEKIRNGLGRSARQINPANASGTAAEPDCA